MHMMSVRIEFGVMDHRRDRRERSFSRSIRVVCLQSSLALDQRRRLESGYKHGQVRFPPRGRSVVAMFSSLERRSADGRLPGLRTVARLEPPAAVGRGAMSCGVCWEKYAGGGPHER